jgi:integrase
MLYAGLRRGEMLAFNIDRDVDLIKGVLHVREAIVFDNNRPVLTDPKTEAGVRTIPLFAPLRVALEGKHGLVLPAKDGGYMTKIGLRRKWDSYLLLLEEMQNGGRNRRWYGQTREDLAHIAAGGQLPPWQEVFIRTHDFRHTFATMLWEASVDLKTSMKWMGHADQTMILRVYAHLTDKKEEEAALKMAEKMNDNSNRSGNHLFSA